MNSARAFLIIFVVLLSFSPAMAEDGKGYITGVVKLEDGEPLSMAFVYLFDAKQGSVPRAFLRVPDHIAGQVGRNGRFEVEAAEGEYFLGIIKRASGAVWGPPQEGDRFYFHRDEDGKSINIAVKAGETTDLGELTAKTFEGPVAPATQVVAKIKGKLTDEEGKPVKDALVMAYTEPNRLGRPRYLSEPSSEDGSYTLQVREVGKFYLVARTRSVMGMGSGSPWAPQEDMLLGRYDGGITPVEVKEGDEVRGIDIRMLRVMMSPAGPQEQ